jgi:hypothetical protein
MSGHRQTASLRFAAETTVFEPHEERALEGNRHGTEMLWIITTIDCLDAQLSHAHPPTQAGPMLGNPRICPFNELHHKAMNDHEKMIEAENQIACIKGDSIVLHPAHGDYQIGLDRCDSHVKIVLWVLHLCEKNWATVPMIKRFVRLACEHHGLEAEGLC